MHKKIKILLAGLLICFMFLLNTSSVLSAVNSGGSCRTDNPLPPSDNAFGGYKKSDYPYFIVSNRCNSLSSGNYWDDVYYSYSSKPITVSSDGLLHYDGPSFNSHVPHGSKFDDFKNPVYFNGSISKTFFTTANHTINDTDGTVLFHAPWATLDAFRPVGERAMELAPIIVGLMVFCLALVICLAVLVKHLRKSARV